MGMPQSESRRTREPAVVELLQHGDIVIEGLLPYSTNHSMLVWVQHHNTSVRAVYKPCRGERPLWDFPHGTLYQREIAAYLVCEALSFCFVPPTVKRDGPYGIGALQLFIYHDAEAHLFTMQEEGLYDTDILRLAAFDYLINNADRKSGHCLKGLDGYLWAIDHGLSFHHENKLRTVLWDFVGQRFPADVVESLQRFKACLEQNDHVARDLAVLLDRLEMRALRQRLETMIHTVQYPHPDGYGPHVPWPPI